MASNFACLGLGLMERDEFTRFVAGIVPAAEPIGEGDGVSVRRWTDPSGVRLVVGLRGGEIIDVQPSFAGAPGAWLRDVSRAKDETVTAGVYDEDGEQVTALAADLEQHRLLGAEPVVGRAGVVAFATDVTVHADAAAFAASDASLLSEDDQDSDAAPPAEYAANGWPWPPRMAPESFISYGVFGDAQPYARLHGVVLAAERRTVAATGGEFSVARVRTAGFEVDLCLPGDVPTPAPGNVAGGTVYLVVDLPALTGRVAGPPKKRSWWRR